MKLRTLYTNEIVAKYSEFLETLDTVPMGNGKSLNLATELCNLLNNVVDYLIVEYPSFIHATFGVATAKALRKKIRDSGVGNGTEKSYGEAFKVINDVADSKKHYELGDKTRSVMDIGRVTESICAIQHTDELGHYHSTRGIILVEFTNGNVAPLEIYIYFAFLMFSNILIGCGCIPKLPNIEKHMRQFDLSRDAASNFQQPNLHFKDGDPVNIKLHKFVFVPNSIIQLRSHEKGDCSEFDINIGNITVVKSIF